MNIYETDKLLAEYLLFHYGSGDEILPWEFGPRDALDFPARVVEENWPSLTANFADSAKRQPRALDLGCAVGRSTFELARHCEEVVGIDFSQSFIDAANTLRETGELGYERMDEGALTTKCVAKAPHGIERARVRFEIGDAMAVSESLGTFDVVLAANLLCRLREPWRCLTQLPRLVRAGGHLILATPCTWLEEFTPCGNWLGGFERDGERVATIDSLTAILGADFTLVQTHEMPFLIREHARKFQWSVAQASVWQRRD